MQQAFGDAQTTIACLAGGIGGTVSDAIGNYAVSKVGAGAQGMGATGLEFCFRAVVSAATFGALHAYMPETSSNIFFSILYFAADRGLMGSALALSRGTVGAATGSLRGMTAPQRKAAPAPACGTGGCGDK